MLCISNRGTRHRWCGGRDMAARLWLIARVGITNSGTRHGWRGGRDVAAGLWIMARRCRRVVIVYGACSCWRCMPATVLHLDILVADACTRLNTLTVINKQQLDSREDED